MNTKSNSEHPIHSIIDDTEEQSCRHQNRGSINTSRNIFAAICQSTSILIFLVIVAIIPGKSHAHVVRLFLT